MDQNETWYGDRPRPWPHCEVRRLPVLGNAAETRRQCLQRTSVRGSEVGQMRVIIEYRAAPQRLRVYISETLGARWTKLGMSIGDCR